MSETAQQERTPLEEAAYKQMNKTVGTGYITRIVGPVVDVKFEDEVPTIYTALTVDGETPVGKVSPVLAVDADHILFIILDATVGVHEELQREVNVRHGLVAVTLYLYLYVISDSW